MSEVRLIDANALKEHKFLTPQVKVIGGRHNGKMREQIIEVYGKGWNDCIDAIIDNAPTVEPEITNEDIQDAIKEGYKEGFEMAKAKCEFNIEDFKQFVEGKIDMQDLYSPSHLFMLLDEYLDMKGGAE